MRHAFGLNQLEADAFFFLLDGGTTADKLAQHLDRDRSTVQRALSTLVKQGLVKREAKSLKGTGKKGYHFVYTAIGTEEARAMIKELVEAVTQHLNNFVKFDWCDSRRK